jgi:hypothetical protein
MTLYFYLPKAISVNQRDQRSQHIEKVITPTMSENDNLEDIKLQAFYEQNRSIKSAQTKPRRGRTYFNMELERRRSFVESHYVGQVMPEELSERTGLSEHQINVCFQKRRSKSKYYIYRTSSRPLVDKATITAQKVSITSNDIDKAQKKLQTDIEEAKKITTNIKATGSNMETRLKNHDQRLSSQSKEMQAHLRDIEDMKLQFKATTASCQQTEVCNINRMDQLKGEYDKMEKNIATNFEKAAAKLEANYKNAAAKLGAKLKTKLNEPGPSRRWRRYPHVHHHGRQTKRRTATDFWGILDTREIPEKIMTAVLDPTADKMRYLFVVCLFSRVPEGRMTVVSSRSHASCRVWARTHRGVP